MSLINDMLRDLDERKSPYAPRQGATEGVRVTPASNRRDKSFASYMGWGGALLIVALAVVLGWHLYGKLADKVVSETAKNPEPVPVTVTEKEKQNAAPPVTLAPSYADISAVDVEHIAGGTRFEISLSKPVQHRVLRHGQQLIIDLPATQLLAALPNLTRHQMISSVDVQSHATGTQLEVMVSEPFKLQTTMFNQPQPRLVLELVAETAPQAAITEVTSESEQSASQNRIETQAELQTVQPTPVFEKTSRAPTLAERDWQTNRRALKLMQQGQLKTARQQLESLLEELPAAHESRASLIALLLSMGATEAAQQQLSQALALEPDRLAFIKLRARLLLSQQNSGEALTLLEAYRSQADQELLALLASAKQRNGEHSEAATLYQRLLEQNNRQPQWWVGLAISLEAVDQRMAALKAYQQALQLPDISPSLANYATTRINQLQ